MIVHEEQLGPQSSGIQRVVLIGHFLTLSSSWTQKAGKNATSFIAVQQT
jgi:hypothetical protein